MKVGIITFHSAHNFGASLQVWAMQEYLRKNGMEAEIINYRNPVIDNVYKIRGKKKAVADGSFLPVSKFYWKKEKRAKISRYIHFEQFIAQELNKGPAYYSLSELKNAVFSYDAVITGSDQIWNKTILKGMDPAYFCDFGEEGMRRISYAASIGSDVLPSNTEDFFREYLEKLDFISVREKNAEEMLRDFTEKKIAVVIDPTLLLEQKDYDKIRIAPKQKKRYILLHNVHIKGEYEALNGMAEEVSKRLKLPIVQNRDEKIFDSEGKPFTGGGPKEFLGKIAGAEYIITDSFHATVFSIIYKKNFISIPPSKRPERLRYLLDVLGLNDHFIRSKKQLPELSKLTIDYNKVDQKLVKLRASSIEFLKKALH